MSTPIEEMTILEKLSHIQNEMNVPKNLYNKFGNYFYRNAETIFESAKAICKKFQTVLIVRDEIEAIGGRFYVKATAELHDYVTGEYVRGVAYAREDEEKKGMDASQVTGSCSSYARKYALNGLFNLDDVKDSDTNEQQEETMNKSKATPKQVEVLLKAYTGDNYKKLLESNGIEKLEDMPRKKANELIDTIMKKQKEKKNNE